MATTKAVTVLFDDVTLTAGAGDTTSALATIDDGYGGSLNVKLTNGGTGPTIPAQVQVQVSPDNSNWYDVGYALLGLTGNNADPSWGDIPVGIGVKYLRCVAGSNTDQNVTVRAEIVEVTAV